MTTYDSILRYPFFHQISGDKVYWFANPIMQEFLYHVFTTPSPAGLFGVVEAITQPDGSLVNGSLVVFGLKKFAFALAWVGFYHHSTDVMISHHLPRPSLKCRI